jgi:hypothetical protein
MSNELTVKVTEREKDGSQWFEATVSIEGLRPTKLARKSDGSTKFTTRSSVTSAAKRLATTLGFQGVETETPAKKAAKKRVRTTT